MQIQVGLKENKHVKRQGEKRSLMLYNTNTITGGIQPYDSTSHFSWHHVLGFAYNFMNQDVTCVKVYPRLKNSLWKKVWESGSLV